MSTFLRDNDIRQARCSGCDHDLICPGAKGAKTDGRVYCSNPDCKHYRTAHKTGPSLNQGGLLAA